MFKLFGKSGNAAEVSEQGAMVVVAYTPMELAALRGDAYSWTAQDADIATGETMLAVRNDSKTRPLVIDRIEIANGNVACRYEMHKITAAYTNAGTAADEINLGGTGEKAPVSATADETGNTQGTVFADICVDAALGSEKRKIGMTLNEGEAVALDQVTESTAGSCTIYGYFPI